MSPLANDNPLEDERGDDDIGASSHQATTDTDAGAVIVLSDSDDDDDETSTTADLVHNNQEDDPSSMGYELLPQEPTEIDQPEMNERLVTLDERTDDDERQVDGEAPEINVNEEASNDIDMNQERVDKIKAAMSGFALPTSSFPAWANVIPEDQWKDRLMSLMSVKPASRSSSLRSTEESC